MSRLDRAEIYCKQRKKERQGQALLQGDPSRDVSPLCGSQFHQFHPSMFAVVIVNDAYYGGP